MSWPSSDVNTTNLDAGSDSPASARADLKDLVDKFNALRAMENQILSNGHKNLIDNPAMLVTQRGTSFTGPASGEYTLDRWQVVKAGTSVVDVSQSTDTPAASSVGSYIANSLEVDVTTADASIAAGDYVNLLYKMEGYDYAPIHQQDFTLSFWVKSSKTGTMCVGLVNSGNNRSYVAEVSISVADTWEKKTVSITSAPSGGTWDFTNGIGLRVSFNLVAGSTFQTTAGAWQTGNFFSTANQTNFLDSTNNIKITAVQLEKGDTATQFQAPSYASQLAKCQRYLQVYGGSTAVEAFASGMCTSTTEVVGTMNLLQSMRAAPTFSVSAASDFAILDATGTRVAAATLTSTHLGKNSVRLDGTVASGLVAGNATQITANNTTSAHMYITSEL